MKAAILGIEKLFEAILADRQVRRDANGGPPFANAFPNGEPLETGRYTGFNAHFGNLGCPRRMSFYLFEKQLELCLISFEMDLHSFFRV
jgi:hypothetical protein